MLAGFAVRLAFAPFYGHAWDMYIWLVSGDLTVNKGINIYEVTELTEFPWGFYAYPPVWLYWLSFATMVYGLQPSLPLQVAVIKLPTILADLAVAWLIYRLCLRLGLTERSATVYMLGWLFNPLTVFLSSVWGMFDSLAVFATLLAVDRLLAGKKASAGVALGVGTAIKIYPLLLLVPFSAYIIQIERRRLSEVVSGFIVPTIVAGLLVSAPYLKNPFALAEKLLFHFRSVGQFTYWTGLATIINPMLLAYISLGLFLILMLYGLLRVLDNGGQNHSVLLRLTSVTLLAFLASSVKVNVQYVLWVLPFLILGLAYSRDKYAKLNLVLLNVAALIFLASTASIPGMYDLRRLGKIVGFQGQTGGLAGAGMVVAAFLAGSRFVGLLMDHLGVSIERWWNVNRVAIISLLLIFAVFISLFPSERGVSLPVMPIRVAIPESVESLFVREDGFGIDSLPILHNITHLVIPLGPDLVNTYNGFNPNADVSRNFRFRLGVETWRMEDLRMLSVSLHDRGYKVLLGLHLRSYYQSVFFGIQGYNATWLTSRNRGLTDADGNIFFQSILVDGYRNISYARYFSEKVKLVGSHLGVDGVYLMGVDWGAGPPVWDSTEMLIRELKSELPRGTELFLELDPYFLDEGSIRRFLGQVDYVVVKTDPWVRGRGEGAGGNYTIENFEIRLRRVAELARRTKATILFGVYAIDFSEGWMTPAVELQAQTSAFSSVNGVGGYVVYHANRYLPYRVTIENYR